MAEFLNSGGLIIINIFKYTVLISCFEVLAFHKEMSKVLNIKYAMIELLYM